MAGAHGVGAVRCDPGRGPAYHRLASRRLVVWGGGQHLALPEAAGGFRWDCVSVATTHPDAPLQELQQRMREAEGRLAEGLCADGVLTVIGGLSSFAGPAVGAVVFGLLRDWITRNVEYWQAVLGVVLLLIILFLPGGVVDGMRRLVRLRLPGSRASPQAPASAEPEPRSAARGRVP